MSRPIKFRGQPIDGSGWVYGYYVYTFEIGYYSQGHTDVPPRLHYIFGDSGDYCEVKAETVGQYTGLNDRNGKEIYDRHKVKFKRFTNEYIGVVHFEKGCFVVKWESVVGSYNEKASHSVYLKDCENIEIIGDEFHFLKGEDNNA
ncbi:YopX family protein [Paenibacillus sp. ACRRX]|uniref:YopX family protein n=1 Tax=Paenibacillus sp. ACRRX TaxID=2918206 RepID=UPI001EF5BB9D|nr:YopX family protein [Paenibacillus sp. ACRRX]MCG7406763.1 YopX family protein [Paenibacillus sp. ACRRX]